MTDRYRGMALQQQGRDWFPHDVTTSHHAGPASRDLDSGRLDETNHAGRRTRNHDGESLMEAAHIQWMKAVDILFRIDCRKDDARVNVTRKRKLNEDPVHFVIRVEPGNLLEQFLLRGVVRKMALHAAQPQLFRFARLAPDIHLRGRIMTDSDDRQSGPHSTINHPAEKRLKFVLDFNGDRFSVDDPGRHWRSPR